MKFFRIIFFILILLSSFNYSHAYEKLDFFDSFHIYTPYIYILQDDTTIEKAKILVLFHDCANKKGKQEEDFDFAKESAKWEDTAEKEKFFIMGFDLYEHDKIFNKKKLDEINNRILMEIDRLQSRCTIQEIKVYVAGTNFGAELALLFNLLYDDYDGAVCMNISRPSNFVMEKIDNCKDKNFYFFHCKKNKSMSVGKVNSLKKKLLKKGATLAETKIYKNPKGVLPNIAYTDAIDKIK